MIIRWGYVIPEPDDGCHISIWYMVNGGPAQHAITYHVFYCEDINPVIDILEKVFPGKTVAFTRAKSLEYEPERRAFPFKIHTKEDEHIPEVSDVR